MKRSLRILIVPALLLCCLATAWGWTGTDVTSDPLLRMPGSQPNDGVGVEIDLTGPNAAANGCFDCHGDGENPGITTGFYWQGSMMAQSARDPIFWAAMTVAGQDSIWALGNPNAMDLCLRCHFPEGWIEGRSSGPTGTEGLNASLMTGDDFDGVHCDVCHRMYDPFFTDQGTREGALADWEETGDVTTALDATLAADQNESALIQFLNGDSFFSSFVPFYASYGTNGGGQFFFAANDGDAMPAYNLKRGSFADANADHTTLYSRYHKSKFFCSTCHDVSNPVLANLGLDPSLADQSGGAHQISEQYDAGKYFHVERTFSEFILSAYGADGGAATNPEFQNLGASDITHVSKCQDCHMRDVVGAGAGGVADRPRGTLHADSGSPLHNLQGGNMWISRILASIDQDGPVYDATNESILSPARALTLDLGPANLPTGFGQALIDGSARAEQQLILAAAIKNVVYDPETGALSFRVLNNTGHKLISGFPEGRRMWVNIRAFDNSTFPLYEVNPYDEAAGTLQGLSYDYTTDTTELPLPGNLNPLTQAYVDELVYEMHPSSSLTGEEETLHFVLADGRYKDNRIPPKGFDIGAAPERESEPVWHGVSAPDYFFAPEYVGGYDQVNLQIAPGATDVVVTLYYQGTSREYIEFLRDEINGTATTLAEPTLAQDQGWNLDADSAYLIQSDPFFANLKDWGDTIWQLWTHNHGLDGSTADVPGITPYAMASASALTALSGDDDFDGLISKYELNTGTDPYNSDTDGDGVNDADDPYPLDPNLSVATPQATYATTTLEFGTTNQVATELLTVTNTGNADLAFNALTPPAAPFSVEAGDDTCTTTLAPGEACTITVTYTPPAVDGDDTDTMTVSTGVGDTVITLNASSSSTPVAAVSVSDSVDPADDATLAFGAWAANMLVEATVTVGNSGNADLSLGTVAAVDSLATPFSISGDTCSGAVIAPAATCSITVHYQSDTIGIYGDSFDIPSDDPDIPDITISLTASALSIGSNNAPEAPVLLAPAPAQTVSFNDPSLNDVTFTWELSQDPENDPVTYEVVYSTDQGFATSDSTFPVTAMVAGSGLMLALIGIPVFSRRRTRIAMLGIALAAATWLLVACGSSGGGGGGDATTTTPTTSTVTPVTGTAEATASGLAAGTTYYWKVLASDDSGNTSVSEIRSFSTP